MTVRALLVAIPRYPDADFPDIPGALAEVDAFTAWLRAAKPDVEIDLCNTPERTTRRALEQTIDQFVARAAGTTEEFYFYFAGHGVSFAAGTRQSLLLTAEFSQPRYSGACLLPLEQLREHLIRALGPGRHFYFINACRNPVDAATLHPTNLGLVRQDFPTGIADCAHTLFSSGDGEFAANNGAFSDALIAGLAGRHGTREFVDGSYAVTFGKLARSLHALVGAVDVPAPSHCDGVLRSGLPPPQLTVLILDATASQTFSLRIRDDFGLATTVQLTGDAHTIPLRTGVYEVAVTSPAGVVQREDSVGPIVLVDDLTLRFRATTRRIVVGHMPAPLPGNPDGIAPRQETGLNSFSVATGDDSTNARAELPLRGPAGRQVLVLNATGNPRDEATFDDRGEATLDLRAGEYEFLVRERDGRELVRMRQLVRPGRNPPLTLAAPGGRLHAAVLRVLGRPADAPTVDFSAPPVGPLPSRPIAAERTRIQLPANIRRRLPSGIAARMDEPSLAQPQAPSTRPAPPQESATTIETDESTGRRVVRNESGVIVGAASQRAEPKIVGFIPLANRARPQQVIITDASETEQRGRATVRKQREERAQAQGRRRKMTVRNMGRRPGGPMSTRITQEMSEAKKRIRVDEVIQIADLAHQMGKKATAVLRLLWGMGMRGLTINNVVDSDTAELVASEFGYTIDNVAFQEDEFIEGWDETAGETRAPVVTIMGHDDHGKTSLLDKIRKAAVAEGEAGGLTQHIGAYKVSTPKGDVVFLDTPGHEAFSAMRTRGAQVTDVVVLVVAADDGIMPTTIEAIKTTREANVPIVVAINKIDKPDANPGRIKQMLMEYHLVGEEFGGDTIIVEVSAKTGKGIDQLLEMLAVQAEILDLRATSEGRAQGVVLKARVDKGRGPISTVLVKAGTLIKGDIMVANEYSGKVRGILDDKGKTLDAVGPSTPVELRGLNGIPSAGDRFNVVENEKAARQLIAHRRETRRRKESIMAPALTDIASRDPGLWLAALGAIDILRQHNDPHNLLDQSWAPESGHGALYLLLTRDDDATVQARVDSASPWLATHPVLDGLHDLRLNRLAGPATLALWIGDGAVVHTVTHVLPGHVTLVTVHPNSVATTGLAVHQYFLRPPAAADPPLRGPPEGLRPGDVVRMWQAQHDFADKRPLVADNRLADVLAWSIGHRCLEPITALLAAYELRRRGQPPNHPQFRSAVTNLLATYPDLPDVAALRRLRDGAGDVHGTPMLTEAASALPEPAVPPDLRRVHDSLWTTWLQPPPPNE